MTRNIMDDGRKLLQPAYDSLFKLTNPANAKKYIYDVPHIMELHNHDFPQVWYCLEGEYKHRVADQVYSCGKGSMIVIPPGVYHRYLVPEGGYVALWRINIRYDIFLNTPPHLYINAIANLFLPAFQKELGWRGPEYIELSAESAHAVESCISRLAMMDFNPQPADWTYGHEVLEDIFSLSELALPERYFPKAMTLTQNRMRPIIRALDYLNRNYARNISAQDLQQISALCQTHFFQMFRQFTGVTYSVYLQQLRILHARDYLAFTNYSLAFISDICGFSNQGHMTNCCKKYLRITPSEVRSRLLEFKKRRPEYKRDVRAFQE